MEDEEIREALGRGDMDAAFRLVQRTHGRAVYSICYRYLKNRTAAEDAMQQTLIAAFENHRQLIEVDRIRAWLIVTASRRCVDALRSSKRSDRRHRDGDDEIDAAPIEGDGALAQLVTAENYRALEDCLATLEPEVAAAVMMRHHEGMSWQQIARAVKLPADTIRMRVNRGAFQRLRACLEAKGFAP